MTPILVIEDDLSVSDVLCRGLRAEGYLVESCSDGVSAVTKATSKHYPILILDRMLPDTDGVQVCEQLRDFGYQGHIIMLTAKNSVAERIEGLKGGADDYMCKPFEFDELLARLEALRRREERKKSPCRPRLLSIGPLKLDLETHTARIGAESIDLTKREFELLHFLMDNNGQTVSRSQILKSVWGYNFEPGTKLVEVYIRYLRKKLDREGSPSIIESLRGVGYRLNL